MAGTAGLTVDEGLAAFVAEEALAGTGIAPGAFWAGFARIVADLGPRRLALLAERDRLQAAIDEWHAAHPGGADRAGERAMLATIGYLLPESETAVVTTTGVDPEIAEVAGPQLVVPVTSPRYVLNAANARWRSLYDALYGTDAIGGAAPSPGPFDPARGRLVVAAVRDLLDDRFPLAAGTHRDTVGYAVAGGALAVRLADGATTAPADPAAFAGWTGDPAAPASVLLRRNGLRLELVIDPEAPVGRLDAAGIADVRIESALTTIVDFEDSVATVDAEDKTAAYRTWLALNRGDLEATFEKGGRTVVRRLAADRAATGPGGGPVVLPGRSVLFVRPVGMLPTTDAVRDADGPIGECLLDTALCVLGALPGRDPAGATPNGRHGSVYVVQPKLHGPEEVAFAVDLLAAVEALLGLPPRTVKLGLMDEERRTSANLGRAIAAAADRLVFVNTGFLDRSGDEIRTATAAGSVVPKGRMRDTTWFGAYERRNVAIAVAAGLPGHGQIGKGMWAMPDRMAAMLHEKVAQPLAGASTAWVPSPTAATLHATHYLRVDVSGARRALPPTASADLDALLTPPLGDPPGTPEERRRELDETVQSILGYVVRWIDRGIGCSTVPDLGGTGLMEDRATLRISSQLLANRLRHGVITPADVEAALRRICPVVDAQNAADPEYRPMAGREDDSLAVGCARALILEGRAQPNGYTEPILFRFRRAAKAAGSASRNLESACAENVL